MFLRLDYTPKSNDLDFSMSMSESFDFTPEGFISVNDFSHIASTDAGEWTKLYSLKNNLLPSSLLPPAIRYISSDRRLVVWERPPTYKTINYTQDYQDNLSVDVDSSHSFRIPIPWQVYILYLSPEARLANVFMFFRNAQLMDFKNDSLFYPILPNFYETGKLCQAAFESVQYYDRDILSAVNAAYDMIWNSGFNKDTLLSFNQIYTANYVRKKNPISLHGSTKGKSPIASFDKWSHYSLNDALSWTWPVIYASPYHFITSGIYKEQLESDSHNFMVNMLFAAQDAPQKNKTIA